MLTLINNRIHDLERASKITIMGICTAIVLVTGILDYVTGFYLSFSLFYLIPIILATRLGGVKIGLFICFESACVWFMADLLALHEYPYLLLPVWNAIIRLCIFMIVSFTYWMMLYNKGKEKELIQFIVHDLRSPLANTKFSLSMLNDQISSKNEKIEKLFDIANNSAERMDMMVSSILDLSRLEQNKMPLHTADTSIQDVFSESSKLISSWLDRQKITLEKHVDSAIQKVHTDKDLLIRIIVNLLSNAIKASPEHSTIRLSCSREGAEIVISVEDEGIGIPQHLHKKVFNKFVQVEARHAGVRLGSGIGLNFCKAAVIALGGRIWSEKAQRNGTKIVFTLPEIQ
ncbi:MAG: HAMP domain-containing sensor histidine kinase [Chlamydiota bacterium]|nr:HAMP domain-containing sensor histidine kinase [Chlamydiota bacterium]